MSCNEPPHFRAMGHHETSGELKFVLALQGTAQTSKQEDGEHLAHGCKVRSMQELTFAHMHTLEEKQAAFSRLLKIMDELREQCPWDRKQTFESLRHLTIEETYELADAILDGDVDEMMKETGDLLLHMVFYARIASEHGAWDIADALHAICDKLIARHPHIYGDVEANDEETVKANWEQLKLKEGNRSVLEGVPKSLPSLVKAYRIQDKVKGVGFDWEHADQVWDKVEEELGEFKVELEAGNHERATDEFGDVLFALINYARFVGINPDEALERTNRRFRGRFMHMEEAVAADGKALQDLSLPQMDAYWERAKVVKG